MKSIIKIMLATVTVAVFCNIVKGEGLYVPNTDGDNLGRADKKFGNVYAGTYSNLTAGAAFSNLNVTTIKSSVISNVLGAVAASNVQATVFLAADGHVGVSGVYTCGMANVSNVFAFYNGIITNVTTIP